MPARRPVRARQGVTGARGERAVFEHEDVVERFPGSTFTVTSVWFADPSVGAIAFVVPGYYPDGRGFRLQLPGGEIVEPLGGGSETGRAVTGEVGQGASSYVQFRYRRPEDLNGVVRLMYGEPTAILNGRWAVEFRPAGP